MPVKEVAYVGMLQNDKEQLVQIVREYDTQPARGIAHGVQKDAIQNGFGARTERDERTAFAGNWRFNFELTKIDGADALVFWDEGTTGLIGDVLNLKELTEKSEAGELGAAGADQKLSRFLTRFESGGNWGPGSFGRGKLIFQGASSKFWIIIDSLRQDKKYIALDRLVKGTRLVQPERPFEDKEAVEFLQDRSGGALEPLKKPGTRITIMHLREDVAAAFRKSFEKDADSADYNECFSKMIEETWWEIVDAGAKISLHLNGKTKRIELTEPLASLVAAKDGVKGYTVYEKKLVPVVTPDKTHKIKLLRFVVSPTKIDDELRDVFIHRKRMKVGGLGRTLRIHHKVHDKLFGYAILDPELERQFEEVESPTHYSFGSPKNKRGGVVQVKEIIRGELDKLYDKLGFRAESDDSVAQEDLRKTLDDLNEQARDLGLEVGPSVGPKTEILDLKVSRIALPQAGTTRVDLGQSVGPIQLAARSNVSRQLRVKVTTSAEQPGRAARALHEMEVTLEPKQTVTLDVSAFAVDAAQYAGGLPLALRFRAIEPDNNNAIVGKTARRLWVAMDPPEKPAEPVSVSALEPIFPRPKTRRVELGEEVRNILFSVTNNEAFPIKANIELIARRSKDPGAAALTTLLNSKGVELQPLATHEFGLDVMSISEGAFGEVFREAVDADVRKCELFFKVSTAEAINKPTLNVPKAHRLARKAIPFYCGVDPRGMSIFKAIHLEESDEAHRSRFDGDRASGFEFYLNISHKAYKFFKRQDPEVKNYYFREQILFQAYLIAVKEGRYSGPAEAFEQYLNVEQIEPDAGAKYFDQLIGSALNQIEVE